MVITSWAYLLGLFHRLLGRMAQTQHDCNDSICLPDLKDLIFDWLQVSAEVSIPAQIHASVFMHCSYPQIFNCCLLSSPYNILPPGTTFISWDSQRPESTFTYEKSPIERECSGIRQTINFIAPTLTQPVLPESTADTGDAAADRDPPYPRSFVWPWAAGPCSRSDGAAGTSASSSARFSS